MTKELKCKFCGVVCRVEIDDAYTVDTFKLERLCACNRCADYRVARKRVFLRIKHYCEDLIQGVDAEGRELCKGRLEELVKRYIRLAADFRHLDEPPYDDSIVDAMMRRPSLFSDQLHRVGSMFAQKQLL